MDSTLDFNGNQARKSNSHFGMITLWELLSSPAVAGWQDAALTAFWNKTDVIIRIAVYITIDFRDRFV